jgi:hypothetical protein
MLEDLGDYVGLYDNIDDDDDDDEWLFLLLERFLISQKD